VGSRWRRAEISDLPDIMEIATQIHPDLAERTEVLGEKMRLSPNGCQMLATGDDIVGYGIAHPWKLHEIPPLDTFLKKLPPQPDCLYVHDVAVLPDFRGRLAARSYIEMIASLARSMRIDCLTLVSVYDTDSMWCRLGFRTIAPDAARRVKLESYGETAKYMICHLGNSRQAGS
jgi:ribosomal protein S18 acetylase RimI-like enzyme